MGKRGANLFFVSLFTLSLIGLVLFGSDFVTSHGSNNYTIVSASEINDLDDSNVLDEFSYLQGYENIAIDVSSNKDFNASTVQKNTNATGNYFEINNLKIRTEYRQQDTSSFNVNERPVKQTYFVKNLLGESRTVKLNLKYEIDSSTVLWNGTNYSLSSTPIYFRAFEETRELPTGEEQTFLGGNVLYFGNNYYDFKDVSGLNYTLSVYSADDKNYVDLELNIDLASSQELMIDPELGWTTHIIDSSADGASSLSVADVDKDGDLDVVTSQLFDNRVIWYENNGSWIERTIATSFLTPTSVFAADINNDTYVDVVSVSHTGIDNGRVIWYENNKSSPPGWTERIIKSNGPPYSPETVVVADLDKDGRMDVIVGEGLGLGEVYYFKNNGGSPPTWTLNTVASSVGDVRSVYAVDMDKDNDTDIVSASRDVDKVEWYQNNGGSPLTWTTRTINTTADDVRSVYAVDLDKDGDMDVLSASRNDDKIAWYDNNGSIPAGWTGRIINTSADGALAVSAADFDGDGDVDVVSGSPNDAKISWYENNGSSLNWTRNTITSSGNNIAFLQAIDLDLDGAIDVVGARSSVVNWYENNGSASINSMTLAQVLENTELVKDKKTLVRTEINASPNSQILVSLYFNNTLKNSTLAVFNGTTSTQTVDLYFRPDVAGTNKEVKVVVFGGIAKKLVNVSATRNLTVTFVSVDNPDDFDDAVSDSIEFIKKTYPLSDTGLIAKPNRTGIHSYITERAPLGIGLPLLMQRVYRSTLIAGDLPERAVGVLPFDWFDDNILGLDGTTGISASFNPGVLVEADYHDLDYIDQLSAHELGHTYGFCDEYDPAEWDRQNTGFLGLFSDLCPNGDTNNDEVLDSQCVPNGCPTSTLDSLRVDPNYTGNLSNFMGNLYVTKSNWISNESYNHLLNEFKHATPISTASRIVVSGIVNGSSDTARFESFYSLGAGLAINRTEYATGNYTIEALNSLGNSIYNFSFDVSFIYFLSGGNSTQINESAFAFTIPFNQSFSRFILKKDGVTKDTRNVSAHVPTLDLTSPPGNQTFTNQVININWTASDSDGDSLSYAVLFSQDNGTTYSTVAIDLNQTFYSINSTDLADGKNYKIKVLATDGANTNSSVMNKTFEVDNDLQVTDFKVIYTNNTERIFLIELNNTSPFSIENISWQFNSGQDEKNSETKFTLQPAETILMYLYNNYSTSGNYNVTFRAAVSNYIETDKIGVTI